MTVTELNNSYVSQYLEAALVLVEEKKHLDVSMLQKHFSLGYSLAALLYEMVDLKLQNHQTSSHLKPDGLSTLI